MVMGTPVTVTEEAASDTESQAVTVRTYTSLADRIEKEEQYLRDNGWEPVGGYDHSGKQFWQDPAGAGPKSATPGPVIELPQRGGGYETVRQMTVPPAAWRYPHDRAVAVQIERERKSGSHESVQERLNRLGAQLDSNTDAMRVLFAEFDKWFKRQIPQKTDNLSAELMNLKHALQRL